MMMCVYSVRIEIQVLWKEEVVVDEEEQMVAYYVFSHNNIKHVSQQGFDSDFVQVNI